MKQQFNICKLKLLTGIIFLLLPNTITAQCNGSWTTTNNLNYLCASGPFLLFDLGANVCPSTAQSTFNFTSPVQNVKLKFSALGTAGFGGTSRMSVFLNNNLIDLNLACRITIGCQNPSGVYSINSGCLVDSLPGADYGISGFIYLEAPAFGLASISSIGVAVSEPSASGTIFQLDSCNLFACITGFNELTSGKIDIYPNPFSDIFNIYNESSELSEILLYDFTSRLIFHQSFTNSISINTESLVKGIYMYELRRKNEVIKKGKVIKQ